MTLILLEGGPDGWAGHIEDYEFAPAQLLKFENPTAFYRQAYPERFVSTDRGSAMVMTYLGARAPFDAYDQKFKSLTAAQVKSIVNHVDDDPLPDDVVALVADIPIDLLGPAGFEGEASKTGFAFRPDFKKYVLEKYRPG